MKLGIIGLGKIAVSTYLPLLSSLQNIDEVIAFTPSKDKLTQLCKQYNLTAATSIDDLLDQVDCVWIHSSTTSHYKIAKQTLNRNIPVYIDKPLAETLEQCIILTQLAKKNDTLLKVGYNRRHAPEYVKLKEVFTKHPPHALHIEKHRSAPTPEDYKITILDDFIHLVDTFDWLTDSQFQMIDVTCNCNENNELLNLSVYYKNENQIGTISTHRTSNVDDEKITAFIDGKKVEVHDMASTTTSNENGTLVSPINLRAIDQYRRGFVPMLTEFLTKVADEQTGFIKDNHYHAQELVEEIIQGIAKQ